MEALRLSAMLMNTHIYTDVHLPGRTKDGGRLGIQLRLKKPAILEVAPNDNRGRDYSRPAAEACRVDRGKLIQHTQWFDCEHVK